MINQTKKKEISNQHQRRLQQISDMLREIRLSQGLQQNDLHEFGLSRRQIQEGEYSKNISLVKLFTLLDCFDYTVEEFFQGIE